MGITSKDYSDAVRYDSQNIENYKLIKTNFQALLLMNEPQLAKDDFEKLLTIEPSNKAAAAQISICRQKMKLLREKEKKIYSNMFDKFARKDEEVRSE